MPYRVEIPPAAGRQIRRLPRQGRDRLELAILSLRNEPRPRGVRKIIGQDRAYRVRVGDYRIAYDILDEQRLVVILWVGRRTESTYRRP